jgi:sugar/nucleoside kinase (ribokinase family)
MDFPFNLAPRTEFDVVGFGTNAVDFLIQVPHYPDYNSKVELSDYVQAAGGEVATTMVGLRRLGLRTAYIGRFGDDAAGEFGLRTLADEGVDTSLAERVQGARTQIAFIVIDERTGERTVIWQRDRKLSYSADEAPLEAVARARVLHMTPHDAAACTRMAKEARRLGVIVSIDIDNVFEGIEDLLTNVDLLVASAELPRKLLGIDDREKALIGLAERSGARLVGVTLGEDGSLLYCGGQFVRTHGFPVPGGCKDTTGAGDAFRVGLLYGLLAGEPVEDAARMANAVASLKCRAIGARTALPDLSEARELLKNV